MRILHVCFASIDPIHAEHNTKFIIERLRSLGNEVINYPFWEDERTLNKIKTRHFQMYEAPLDYAADISADLIIFEDNLASPEYLYFSIKARPNYKPKIVFFMTFREVNKSLARSLVIKELLELPQIHKILGTTMIVKDFRWPENLIKAEANLKKIELVNEPYDEDPELFNITKLEARKKYAFADNDFIVLYSGRWIYARGADIFAESLKYLDDKIKVVIHYIPFVMDIKKETLDIAGHNHKNTIFIEERFPEGKLPDLYSSANICVCSHRRLYEYSQSGVPGMSFCAKNPIVAPDFYYFNEIVKKNKVGVLFEPENAKSLGNAIMVLRDNYDKIIERADFKSALSDYIPKSHWADKALL
jgi:glycosyltransferase involved in cell wall biosynthesis